MKLSFRCFSQRGVGKAHNEDAVLLNGKVHQGSVREHGIADTAQPRYFAVADGVSAGTRPRTASKRLLELLQTRLAAADVSSALAPILAHVQRDYAALAADPASNGMASTLVGVRLFGNVATIFNVGDSRAYLLSDGKARLLSHDHSLLSDMIDDGDITPAEAANAASFMRCLTSQFIADAEFEEFKLNIVTHVLQPGERLLLCSDGLNEVLGDGEIATLFAGSADDALLKACKASRREGGTDDFSAIVLARDSVINPLPGPTCYRLALSIAFQA